VREGKDRLETAPAWDTDIVAFLAGDPSAADRLAVFLKSHVQKAASAMLGAASVDVDDVAQEAVMAILEHIRRRGGFEGDLVVFAITVARNRCRNLIGWRQRHAAAPLEAWAELVPDGERSPLDILLENEVLELLQLALDDLGAECRELLRAFYLDGKSIEEIRRRTGLNTVQGVYYRKGVCLDQVHRFLKRRMTMCSRDNHGEQERV
jgi:RNA polymerase sigma factor (sigma-70 family)